MPLMMLLFGQQDQLGNEGHKKIIHFNKITLNVFIHCIPIFNNIWQNRCTIILKNTIKFFFEQCVSAGKFLQNAGDLVGLVFILKLRVANYELNLELQFRKKIAKSKFETASC